MRLSCRQALLIAQHTLREAMRARLVGWLGVLGFALAVGARWLREFNFGLAELDFLADCGFGAMAFFGAALSITAASQFFLGELENRSVLTLLAKPVGRTEFVVGKFLGVAALLGGFCAGLGLLLGLMLLWRHAALAVVTEAGPGASLWGLAVGTFLQWLRLAVLAAFVLLVASFARTQLFAITAGVFLLVIFHLQPVAHEAWSRGGSWFGPAVAMALPNFQLFASGHGVSGPAIVSAPNLIRITAYGVGYMAVACGLAALSFHRREL
jgi:hypothetical protein